MALLWFRYYSETLNDPKVQNLPGELFKAWVNILCIASQREGKLPPISELAFLLRETESRVSAWFAELVAVGLIDERKRGFEPHAWAKRQYKSDTSTERVKRYRKRYGNVTETPPEQTQIQNRTEKKRKKKVLTPEQREGFERFKKTYPPRTGSQNWAQAEIYYLDILETTEVTAEDLEKSARVYAAQMARVEDRSTVQQACTFLGPKKQTWREYLGVEAIPPPTQNPKSKIREELERIVENGE